MDNTDNTDNTSSGYADRVRLPSTEWCYTPGLIRDIRLLRGGLGAEASERAQLVFMLAVAFPDAPAWALLQMIERDGYTVEGEDVVVVRAVRE